MVFMGLIKALLELYILVLCFIEVMPDVQSSKCFFFFKSTNCILIEKCPWTWKLLLHVQADAGFLCNEAAVLTNIMRELQ